MSEPTAANDHEQHTTTIEITGNGQVNAAFENTEGPDGAPTPQTPPPQPHIQRPSSPPPQTPRPTTPPPQVPSAQQDTTHMNGETPHMNGETKTNGVELRTPGTGETKEVNEAVNLELVNMQPYSNSIPIKKESTELDIGDPYDEYFVPVNQHKKYMRGEKLYVTQDKRRSLGGSKKKCCWGVLTVIVLGGIVAILLGVILSSQDNTPVEESRNFNGMRAGIGGSFIPTPSPSSTPQPPRPTTDMSEIYLKNVLQGELTIDNLEFTPGLADHNSSEFKNLAASLEDELKSALFDHQTLHYGSANITVKVLEFRSGSVVVVYRVGWEFKDGIKNPPDPIDKDALKVRLQDHLRSHDGFLYNYRLTLHNLKSERVTDACKIENGGCSQNCVFDRNNLKMTCTCEELYILSSDGKTCIILENDKSESSPSSDQEQETSSETHQYSLSEHEHDKEHSPAADVPTETNAPQETESFAETESPSEHKHSDISDIQDKPEFIGIPHSSQEPLPEYNTSEMYENDDYQSMEHFNPKSTSESDMVQETMTESGGNPLENTSAGHNKYLGEQSTEGYSNFRETDMTMGIITSEPSLNTESSSQSQNMSESGLAVEPISSSTSMDSLKDIQMDMNSNMTYATTLAPTMTLYPEEKNHWSDDSHEVPETYEYPDEYSSIESSSVIPSSSSERLPKYNQFSPATSEAEDALYTTKTDYGLQSEITTHLPITDQQMTMPALPEYKTEDHSEESQSLLPSSSQPNINSTDFQEEITTKKFYFDSSEIKTYDRPATDVINTMTTPSSTPKISAEPGPIEESLSPEMLPTTVKSFNIWERVEGNLLNVTEESFLNNKNNSNEAEGMVETTMMTLIENMEVKQGEMLTTHDFRSLENNSVPTEVTSESHTDQSSMDHVISSLNKTDFESSQSLPNMEINTTPIEDAHGNFSHSFEHTTIIPTTLITLSPNNPVDIISTNSQSSSSKENMNETTEIPSESESHFTSGANNRTINETAMDVDIVPTTEPMLPSNKNVDELEESKVDMPYDSDSMAPRFIVEGENMPSIALTPNPDLSGPYSVDSTIQPVTEEDDSEEIKSTKTVSSEEPSSSDEDHSNNWYDSKNALNSLDDDYNEEEKYANYKLAKGKHEHITKGYKNIKIEETGRVPQDNDAVEQTHTHQTEHVPIAIRNESDSLAVTELHESHTHYPITETTLPMIKEEEKLLIEEVYTEGTIDNIKPIKNADIFTKPLSDSPDFTTMSSIESSQASVRPSESTEVSSSTSAQVKEELELKEMGDILEENKSNSNIGEKDNMNSTLENTTSTDMGITTLNSADMNAGYSSENVSTSEINTTLHSLEPKENDKSDTSSPPDMPHSSDNVSTPLINSNSKEDERTILNSPLDAISSTDIPTTFNYPIEKDDSPSSVNINSSDFVPTTLSSIISSSESNSEQNIESSMISHAETNISTTECNSDQFACHDGSRCLLKSQQCDSITDCIDGSDEHDCMKLNCSENFKCNDGSCISKHLVCNGLQNCPDGGDEQNCDSEGKNLEKYTERPNAIETTDTRSPQENIEHMPTEAVPISSSNTEVPESVTEQTASSTGPSNSIAPMEDVLGNTSNVEVSSTTSENPMPQNLDDSPSHISSEGTVSSSTEGTTGEINSSIEHVSNATNSSGENPPVNTVETTTENSPNKNQEVLEGMTTMEPPANSSDHNLHNSGELVSDTTLSPPNSVESVSNETLSQSNPMELDQPILS